MLHLVNTGLSYDLYNGTKKIASYSFERKAIDMARHFMVTFGLKIDDELFRKMY